MVEPVRSTAETDPQARRICALGTRTRNDWGDPPRHPPTEFSACLLGPRDEAPVLLDGPRGREEVLKSHGEPLLCLGCDPAYSEEAAGLLHQVLGRK